VPDRTPQRRQVGEDDDHDDDDDHYGDDDRVIRMDGDGDIDDDSNDPTGPRRTETRRRSRPVASRWRFSSSRTWPI
jgi:hypothetical protein